MGGQRVGAIDVEARDAAHLAILGEVILVARNQHRPAGEANEQCLMAFGMTRHLKYLHPPIAEHVLVAFERLDLASPGQPVAEARLGGLPDLDHFPVALAGEQGRVREIRDLAGMVRSEEHTSELQSLMRTSYAV